MITGKINCAAIDKSKLFKNEKVTYLDIVLFETPDSEYGDYVIVQGVSKEQRLAGVKGPILGNARVFQKKGSAAPPAPKQASELDDVPF